MIQQGILNWGKFFAGMFLAYLLMSPKIQSVLRDNINILLHKPILNQESPLPHNAKHSSFGEDKGKVIADESEIEQWLKNNPDLREANKE